MTRTYHQDIFYPKNLKFEEKDFFKLNKIDTSLFVVLPHASYNYIEKILQIAFQSLKDFNFNQITILGSMHRPMLEIDKDCYVATRKSGLINNELININLISLEKEGIAIREDYFIEESCAEITLPFVSHYFPNIPVLQILAPTYSTKLNILLDQLKAQNNLIIITDNFSDKVHNIINNDYVIDKALTPTSGIWIKAAGGNWSILMSNKIKLNYCFATREEYL